jgi:hypothetical protein
MGSPPDLESATAHTHMPCTWRHDPSRPQMLTGKRFDITLSSFDHESSYRLQRYSSAWGNCKCLGMTTHLCIKVEHLTSLAVYCNCISYQSTMTLLDHFIKPVSEARVIWVTGHQFLTVTPVSTYHTSLIGTYEEINPK